MTPARNTVGLSFVVFGLLASPLHAESSSLVVPDVTGLKRPDAEAKLRAAGVRGEIIINGGEESYDFAVATVCGLSPGAGSTTLSSLSITVGYCPAKGRVRIPEPDLRGLSVEEATKRIKATAFHGRLLIGYTTQFIPNCAAETVCRVKGWDWWLGGGDQMLNLVVYRKPKISAPK